SKNVIASCLFVSIDTDAPCSRSILIPPRDGTSHGGRFDRARGQSAPKEMRSEENRMELRVDGKVAIITGADSGIGRGIALRLAESGADVMICYYSDRDGAEQTAADCRAFGRRTGIAQGDIGNPAVVRGIFEQLDLDFGRVD